jgi:hypothetical protein
MSTLMTATGRVGTRFRCCNPKLLLANVAGGNKDTYEISLGQTLNSHHGYVKLLGLGAIAGRVRLRGNCSSFCLRRRAGGPLTSESIWHWGRLRDKRLEG